MLTNSRTTYILLERGLEDRALYVELLKLIAQPMKAGGPRWLHKNYPLVGKLIAGLRDETTPVEERL